MIFNAPDTLFKGTNSVLGAALFAKATTGSNSQSFLPNSTYFGTLAAAQRYGELYGTNLTTSAFSFVGNWGSTPSFTSVTGTDSGFMLVFSSGSGSPLPGPGITLTFADGTWTNPPVCVPSPGYWVYNLPGISNGATFSYIGTPAPSTSYNLTVICNGKQN